jgi:polyketide biosynthesis acyl carrier protein
VDCVSEAEVSEEQVFGILVGHVRTVLPNLASHEFTSADSLKALGANSVDRSEIVMMTIETLKLDMSLVEVAGASTLGELARIMRGKVVHA